MRGWRNERHRGGGGKRPEDLRPLGLVNIFKSGLMKGI